MHRLDARAGTLSVLSVLVCATLLGGARTGGAQERIVVANTIVVSGDEASLRLEFSDGDHLELSFVDGIVHAGGESLGRFEPDGEADRAWRMLLADVLSLTNGPLAQRLLEWQPGETASVAEHGLLEDLDERLESALARPGLAPPAGGDIHALDESDWAAALAEVARNEGIWDAIRQVDPAAFSVLATENHVVPAGEVVEGDILVPSGRRLDVRGTVRGDVILVHATLAVHEGGRVLGDVRHVDSRIERMGGTLAGNVADMVRERRRADERERDRLRAEILREVRAEEAHMHRHRRPSFFGRIGSALSGVVATAVAFAVLGVLASVASMAAGGRGDLIAKAVRHDAARSAAVGLAGGFVTVPVFVLGVVALAVTIIGIPGLLVWVPLFWPAVAAAVFVGFVAVARNVGLVVLDRGYGFLAWANPGDRVHATLAGLGAIFLPMAVGQALDPLPLIGWAGGLLQAFFWMAVAAAAVTGFGAVLTTRGGQRMGGNHAIHDDLDAAAWSSGDHFSAREAQRARETSRAEAEAASESEETVEAQEAPGDSQPADAAEEEAPPAGEAAGEGEDDRP